VISRLAQSRFFLATVSLENPLKLEIVTNCPCFSMDPAHATALHQALCPNLEAMQASTAARAYHQQGASLSSIGQKPYTQAQFDNQRKNLTNAMQNL
jgi:hypothetical protein